MEVYSFILPTVCQKKKFCLQATSVRLCRCAILLLEKMVVQFWENLQKNNFSQIKVLNRTKIKKYLAFFKFIVFT